MFGSPHPLPSIETYRQDAEGSDQPRVPEEGTTAELEQGTAPAGTDGQMWGQTWGLHSPISAQMHPLGAPRAHL